MRPRRGLELRSSQHGGCAHLWEEEIGGGRPLKDRQLHSQPHSTHVMRAPRVAGPGIGRPGFMPWSNGRPRPSSDVVDVSVLLIA